VKKAKAILIVLAAVIVSGGLLIFASPAPQIEKGIGPLKPVFIGLSALVGVILLVIFVKNIRAIIQATAAGLASVITIVVAGGLVLVLVYVSWPAEIALKADLLRSVLIASLVLLGFVSFMFIRLIRGGGDLSAKLGISDAGMAKFGIFILRSAALGCLTLLAIVVYFLTDEVNLFFIAWLFFILQLGLLVFPLIFSRIMIFR